ncbi:MAG TPA: ROK family protein [Dehalococcoidia bacterium]|nr:ROK family protein [Dehalococcoidia bacterium]
MKDRIYGGIETGGTKFVCGVGTAPDNIVKTQFATTSPDESIGKAIDFFKNNSDQEQLIAIGIASFGPVDLDKNSPTYGYITTTPKDSWSNISIVEKIRSQLSVPVVIDTDVNGAALGEQVWGAARGLDTFIYLTVGTGIGGGGIVNGGLMHGLLHPEMGHIRVPHDWEKDPYRGCCPFHGDCLEGLASGKAMELRWGQSPENLPAEHPAWELEAGYLASAINNFIYTISPQRIIVGGGLIKNPDLMPAVRQKVLESLNGYLHSEAITRDIDHYIVAPELGDLAGVIGALELAKRIRQGI